MSIDHCSWGPLTCICINLNVVGSDSLKVEVCRFRVSCVTMSRRDDRDRSRTRRRRDRSPSPQAHKARRREHNDNQVSENMDWNNLVSWQHNPGYNAANNFPMMPANFQSTHNPTQQFQYPAINYMMPIPPDPTPSKFMPPVMPPPVTTSQPTPTRTSCGSTGSSSESLAYSLA